MKKYFDLFLKIVLTLIIITPVLGATGVFPAPTADLYNTAQAFAFIQMMMGSYLVYGVAITCLVAAVLLWTGHAPLATLLLLPVTANVTGFHAFLDGGLLTAGAIMGNVMLAINLYFLWKYKAVYKVLVSKSA